MRPGQNNKRMRGRPNNNRKGPNPLTRSYESSGPDVKIRGTAHHIGEKYLQLARDAQSSGDPVTAESYLQHAEHYFRLIAVAQQAQQQSAVGYQRQPGEPIAEEVRRRRRFHRHFQIDSLRRPNVSRRPNPLSRSSLSPAIRSQVRIAPFTATAAMAIRKNRVTSVRTAVRVRIGLSRKALPAGQALPGKILPGSALFRPQRQPRSQRPTGSDRL